MAVAVVDKQQQATLTGWRAALIYGFGIVLAHRVLLTLWMAIVWSIVGASLGSTRIDFHSVNAQLPALTSPLEQSVFGVWRRWDAVHYLDLAHNGYRLDNPGATVFNVLTPLAFRAADALLPGSIDLAALVVETAAFALALTLLYRFVTIAFPHEDGDDSLARWSVAIVALQPLSVFFAAPMSESIYLACVVGMFYCLAIRRVPLAALCGFLATLTRSQGALLIGVAVLYLLEQERFPFTQPRSWWSAARPLIRRAWTLALIPFGLILFYAYRAGLNLPPLEQVYAASSYVFFTNPLDGLLINLRWIGTHVSQALVNPDAWAILVCILLLLLQIRLKRHRRWALIAYTAGYLLVYISKVNWVWGTDELYMTQSFSRYALVLFPFSILIADGFRSTTKWGRIVGAVVLAFGVISFGALFVLALVGP